MKYPLFFSALFLGVLHSSALYAATENQPEVNVYTLRQPELLNPVLEGFTKETGIKVNATWAQNSLLARLQAEGKNSAADVVITTDVSRLEEIRKAGLFTSINHTALLNKLPPYLIGEENQWIGLTQRVRVIVASKDRISIDEAPKTYEALADPKWKGRICTRSGKHSYNIGLFASMIGARGEAETKVWLQGLKANLVRKPTGNDRSQARAIYEGACDISLINSYYLGVMATNEKEPIQKEWYQSLRVIFPNQADRGAHVNLSGIGVLKYAKNKESALKLVDYLLSHEAQQTYANLNFEFPVIPYKEKLNSSSEGSIELSPIMASWGTFKEDTLPMQKVSEYSAKASQLVDEVKYDF